MGVRPTSFGDSVLIADFIKKLGIEERLDSYLPKAGSNRGYKPSQKILSFISSVMLSGEDRYVYTAPIVKTSFLVFLFLLIHIYLYSLSGGQGDVPPHLAPLIHAAFSKYSL